MQPAFLALLAIALFAQGASARAPFYWSSEPGTQLAGDYLSLADTDYGDQTGRTGGQRSALRGQYAPGDDSPWLFGAGHEYDALDIETVAESEPQTNGDHHTLHAFGQWRATVAAGTPRLTLAPALSVSSNGLKNPEELDRETAQLWGAAVYYRQRGAITWVAGAARDYRFGRGEIYPVAGLQWRSKQSIVSLVYPDLLLGRDIGNGWSLQLTTSPDGNEWLAYDRDMQQRDSFRREAWQSDLRLLYDFQSGLQFGMSAGFHWNQEWRYRQEDGAIARPDSEDGTFFGLHVGWYSR